VPVDKKKLKFRYLNFILIIFVLVDDFVLDGEGLGDLA